MKSETNSKKNNPTFLQKFWWIFPVLIIVSTSLYAYLLLQKNDETSYDPNTAELVDCLGTDNESNIDCWYDRLGVLIAQEPDTKVAFSDVKKAYDESSYVKSNCHQIAHIIGRAAGKKYSSVSSAYQQGDSFCWSGYYHGVMEAVTAQIGAETILTQLNDICSELKETEQYSFDHYNCVHGLGHGVLQLKDSELFVALNVCDELEGSWQQESCQGGVFMENVMNEINPGHSTVYLKDDEPLYPCTAVENRYKQQCYLMQTSHALTVVNQDYNKIFELCTTVESPFDTTCFQSVGRDASGGSSSDKETTLRLCNLGLTVSARENCFIGAVKDFLSYFHNNTEGIELCNGILESDIKLTCLNTQENYYKTF